MFVLADIEWVTNKAGHFSPTQLAAVKVDSDWNAVKQYFSYIRPRDPEFYQWEHIAYSGGRAKDFLYAKKAHKVFADFEKWLDDDDVLLWWYSESDDIFKKIAGVLLKQPEPHKSAFINLHVYDFLSEQKVVSHGNPYQIASERGIEVPAVMHDSQNDVKVMIELMADIKYPQERLLLPLEKKLFTSARSKDMPYQYDPGTNLIHIKDCPQLTQETATQGFENFKTPIRKGHKPCECCKEEYRTALRERNRDIISRTLYTYIYTPSSDVFHRPDCGLMLSAKGIMGTRKYESVIKTGRHPCKRCNPTAEDKQKPLPPQPEQTPQPPKKKHEINRALSADELKAVKRFKQAKKERFSKLNERPLTETEKYDIFTLTQPGLAFWAAKGYQTFHLRSCSKLNGLTQITGFATYKDAVRAGFTPCRKCRPSPKHDVKLSIPINNKTRTGEKTENLAFLCQEAGYSYEIDEPYFIMETPAGRWRINTTTRPVKVEHINLLRGRNTDEFHNQPRIFMSLLDTFTYIKRHDDTLLQKEAEKHQADLPDTPTNQNQPKDGENL